LEIHGRAASLVMLRIAETIPAYAGLTYPKISAVHDQWPIVHREDLFYGGTSYENRQGLGVQLKAGPAPAKPAATAAALAVPAPAAGQVLAVPVTRLYDRGQTVAPSVLLHARMAGPELRMNARTAEKLTLQHLAAASVAIDGQSYPVNIIVDETLPDAVATLPRSVGVPLFAPAALTVVPAAVEAAGVK
jgi:NADH-quinone oxidoreductase subunit G